MSRMNDSKLWDHVCKYYEEEFGKEERPKVEEAVEALKGKSIVLFLGAGCSPKMPQWSKLLQKLSASVSLPDDELSPHQYLETAGIIEYELYKTVKKELKEANEERYGVGADDDSLDRLASTKAALLLSELVRNLLADHIEKSGIKNDLDKILQSQVDPSDILQSTAPSVIESLVEACVERYSRKLRTIIVTYNYEDIFEFFLRRKLKTYLENRHSEEDPIVPTVDEVVRVHTYKPNSSGIHDGIRALMDNEAGIDIFYVHGSLPFLCRDVHLPSEGIVLSEQSYQKLKERMLAFSNHIQYTLLSGYPSLFVGFSGDDPNYRRLKSDLNTSGVITPPSLLLEYCKNTTTECIACGQDKHYACCREKCTQKNRIAFRCKTLEYRGILPLVIPGWHLNKFISEVLISPLSSATAKMS